MEDPDWLQIVYVFDEEPSSATYEELVEEFPRNEGPEYDVNEFNIKYQSEDDGTEHVYADAETALEALTTPQYCSIEVWMDRYGIDVAFEKTDAGLLSYSSLPYLEFLTTIYSFRDPDDEADLTAVKQRRRGFVEFLAKVANVLEPKWGFGRRIGITVGEDETVEDLAAMTTPPLYEYNVFRSETVEALGRERVLSSPAWYVEELDSGGVFLAVREPPRQCGHASETCVEVADHLGVPLARTERYF